MSMLQSNRSWSVLLACTLWGTQALAASTDISGGPLTTSAPNDVKTNLMFVLDDSGSMDWDYMPDWVQTALCRSTGATLTNSGNFGATCTNLKPAARSAQFNSVYYNPAIRYRPPVKSNGTSFPEQTAANTSTWASVKNDAYGIQDTGSTNLVTSYRDEEWCTDTTYSDCMRPGNYVLPGTVGGKTYTTRRDRSATGTGLIAVGAPDAPTTESRTFGPHYYTIVPSEYCNSPSLRVCQATQTEAYSYPAPLRWCNSDANARAASPAANACQAVRTSTYSNARYPTKYFTAGTTGSPAIAAQPAFGTFTLSVNNCSSRTISITSVRVGTTELLAAATPTRTNPGANTVAADIRTQINARTGVTGFSASGNNASITITAPLSAGNLTSSISFSRNASNSNCNIGTNPNPPRFGNYVAPVASVPATPAGYPGSWVRTDIVSTVISYPKSASRNDCAGSTCTYAEEMTNFANWFTYYRTRMQLMKTAASLAFEPVSDRFRVGYYSINNNTGTDYTNLDTFSGTVKDKWFEKLFKANPNNSTPLRVALSNVGRLYAGKLTGSLRGSTVVDPMQYSCQRNVTLLSTDGYWNETSTPTNIGGTAIGNQDGSPLTAPYLDSTGTANTLSDVAQYYYATDIRDSTAFSNCTGSKGLDVCENNVPQGVKDTANTQHMTTYTLGLGASGFMQFSQDYENDTSGDYYAVANGVLSNASAGVCNWQTGGDCTWPTPASNTQTTIDDLWHAAVNGRGTYFSATDPQTLYTGLSKALAEIDAQGGSGAAATTSNPNVVQGDNFVFSSTFRTVEWSGELVRQEINISTGRLSATNDWSAQGQLNTKTARTIYTFDPSDATDKLKSFEWDNLSTAEKAFFGLPHITASGRALSQFCTFGTTCLSSTAQSDAAGKKLVDFLRGVRVDEGDELQTDKYFRRRAHLLGDIVSSEAVYVAKPQYNYADAGYAAFKSAQATRQGMVYVGSNDGMLHAFNAATGEEMWAYVPTTVLPNLYKLADKDYASRYQAFVDGLPISADVKIGGVWRTVLVSGLGRGGNGYFALDVTDPAAPKALWEFTNNTAASSSYIKSANLGLSFGRPEVTKLKTGKWVALLPSGQNNNVVSGSTGRGYLFVIDLDTAVTDPASALSAIDTGAGSTTTPAGLAQIRGWVETTEVDNTVQRVYGGDNLGNVWRFDVNGDIGATGKDAQLLATLRGTSGNAQPVTARPELGLVGSYPVVFVGTGRYLGLSDLTDGSQQSIYAIKDRLDATSYGNPRTSTSYTFVQQTLTNATCPAGRSYCDQGDNIRTASSNPVNFGSDSGWYVDLPGTRERADSDPQLGLGTLAVTTNVLNPSACTAEGSSFLNFFDYRTGGAVSSANGMVSVQLSTEALGTRPVLVRLPDNKVVSLTRTSDGNTIVNDVPIGTVSGATRRLSWREITNDR